jgi:hypothetical protein
MFQITQHARHVDQNVDLAEGGYALSHHAAGFLVIAHRVVVGDGRAACRADLLDDIISGALFSGFAAASNPWIVHEHAGTLARQQQRHLTSNTSACASHDGGFSFEMHTSVSCVV